MKVGSAVTCFKNGEKSGALLRIRVFSVHQLKIKLKTSMTLVSSKLYPQLVSRDSTSMPCETTRRAKFTCESLCMQLCVSLILVLASCDVQQSL